MAKGGRKEEKKRKKRKERKSKGDTNKTERMKSMAAPRMERTHTSEESEQGTLIATPFQTIEGPAASSLLRKVDGSEHAGLQVDGPRTQALNSRKALQTGGDVSWKKNRVRRGPFDAHCATASRKEVDPENDK